MGNDKKIQRKDQRIAQLEKSLREARQKYEKLLAQCANLTTAMDSMGKSATGASSNVGARPRNVIRAVRGGTSRVDTNEGSMSTGYPSPESSPVADSPTRIGQRIAVAGPPQPVAMSRRM